MLFLHLKKGFDTMDHTVLISKLERYGIRGIILNWVRSYQVAGNNCEVGRVFFLVLGHCLWRPLTVGVGSQTVYFLH